MAKKEKESKKEAPAPRRAAEIPPLKPGDLVVVHVRIIEGDKERVQAFQGTVISIRGSGVNKSFTVRKASRGFGVERIFPFASPAIDKVEVKKHSKVRRAKLYYLRGRGGREAMLKEQKLEGKPRPEAVEQ